jgi:hypothetical protein
MILTVYSHFRNQHYTTFGVCNGDALHLVRDMNEFFKHSLGEFQISSCQCSTLQNVIFFFFFLVSLSLISVAPGNEVYFANKKMFQSRLISKRAKLKLYYSYILM